MTKGYLIDVHKHGILHMSKRILWRRGTYKTLTKQRKNINPIEDHCVSDITHDIWIWHQFPWYKAFV